MKTPGLNFNVEARQKLEDSEWLYTKYISNRESVASIADELGCHDLTVKSALEKFNIPVRSKSQSLKGIKKTEAWKEAISNARREKCSAKGAANPNWMGGKTKLSYVERSKLSALRLLVKKRDNYSCVMCGVREHICISCKQFVILHVDHIIPFSESIEKRFDINNLQTLCVACHKMKTKQDAQKT